MTRTAWLGAALGLGALLPSQAAAFIGPYTGVGRGTLDRVRNVDNQNPDPADRMLPKPSIRKL